MLNNLRKNSLAVVIVVGIVLSIVVSHFDAQQSAKDQREVLAQQSITRCIASAPRAAYDIAFQYQAGEARQAAGNIVTAEKYRALANAGVATVAAPKGHAGDQALVEVIYVKTADPKNPLVAQLTPLALALQKAGCEQAYS
jgi:hypothetical protein